MFKLKFRTTLFAVCVTTFVFAAIVDITQANPIVKRQAGSKVAPSGDPNQPIPQPLTATAPEPDPSIRENPPEAIPTREENQPKPAPKNEPQPDAIPMAPPKATVDIKSNPIESTIQPDKETPIATKPQIGKRFLGQFTKGGQSRSAIVLRYIYNFAHSQRLAYSLVCLS